MNHSFNTDTVKLDIVRYESTCTHRRKGGEDRTLVVLLMHLASAASVFCVLIDPPKNGA